MSEDFKNISWPGWETVRLIGRGSFGAVYEIERKVFDETEKAALKVISIPQNSGDIDDMYSDGYDEESITSTFKSHLQSIVAEYSLMRKMNGSANIVNCDDVRYIQHDDGIGWDIFIKMELLTPLKKALSGNVDEKTVIKITKDMCGALELCKKHGIVHRDIKPENIFVSEHGDYKLGDFGISKTVEKTMGGTLAGTPKYMAPEVYHYQPYGHTADIYSLGLVLYWLLNERRIPFMPLPPQKLKAGAEEEAKNRRMAGEILPEPAHGSKRLKQIVLKACAYDPKERYQTATEMLQDIDNLLGIPVKLEPPAPPEPKLEPPVPVTPPQPESKKKSKLPLILGIVAVGIIVIILLLLRSCDSGKPNDDHPQGTTNSTTAEGSEQLEWSDWIDKLPAGITADKYEIEEKTLYSSRTQKITSSTEKKTMDGWELFDTVEANGEFGPWSDWSATKVDPSATREVETQTRYRYRDKETTTSSSSTKDGWTKYDTTYSWGNYGSWSSWSTSVVSNSDSRKVETKTQYRYRSISYSTEYTSWGSWSSWQDSAVSETDLRDVETRTAYHYYYYICNYCGHRSPASNYCYPWDGGCGGTSCGSYTSLRSTTPYSSTTNFGVYQIFYTTIDGNKVFAYIYPDSAPYQAPITQYRYRTRSTQQVANYGSWSGWGDTAYSNSSSRQVETRKVYRYCDRSQVANYHFYRWGGWSNWSENKISATNDRQVENTTYYRYRDQVKTTTYYFKRWTDWSTYSETVVTPSQTVEVQTKTQYRYKLKENE